MAKVFRVTWKGDTINLLPGRTLFLNNRVNLTIEASGVIKLPRAFQNTKFFPRELWINKLTPKVLSKGEWSDSLKLVEGMVEFDILGEPLLIEVVEI